MIQIFQNDRSQRGRGRGKRGGRKERDYRDGVGNIGKNKEGRVIEIQAYRQKQTYKKGRTETRKRSRYLETSKSREKRKRKNKSKREIERQINILCKSCIFYNTGESVGRKDTFSRFVP